MKARVQQAGGIGDVYVMSCPPLEKSRLQNMIRFFWLLCIAVTLWFALIPADMGGLGGAQYHGAAFLVLGFLTPAVFPRVPLIVSWGTLLVLGGGIELAQGMMGEGRHGEWDDFVTDSVAATGGIICYWIWLSIRAKLSSDDTSEEELADADNLDHEPQDF